MPADHSITDRNHVINAIAIIVLLLATAFSHVWVWGLLFCFWAVRGFQAGKAFLLSELTSRQAPGTSFAINLMWLVFGIWYIVVDTLWRFGVGTILGFAIYGDASQ